VESHNGTLSLGSCISAALTVLSIGNRTLSSGFSRWLPISV
jgi:hypothetical protein